MSLLISAYYKAYVENPKINCFVMNRRTDMRNYFCVFLVILKTLAAGFSDETTLKAFVEKHDTIYTLTRKLEDAIRQNTQETHRNTTDKFVKAAFAVPGLARLVFWLAYHLDLHGLLPGKIMDLSPFHTSLFVTNLGRLIPATSTITAMSLAPPAYSSAWASRCRTIRTRSAAAS